MKDNTKVKGRRNFIKTGLAGITGAFLVPSFPGKDKTSLRPQKKDRKWSNLLISHRRQQQRPGGANRLQRRQDWQNCKRPAKDNNHTDFHRS